MSSRFTWSDYLKACKRLGQTPEVRKQPLTLAQSVLKAEAPGSELEALFDATLQRLAPHIPKPVNEFKPWEDSGHVCDRVWPAQRVIVEIEGYGHGLSRYEGDLFKYNKLASEGWCLLRCSRRTLEDTPHAFLILLVETLERRTL